MDTNYRSGTEVIKYAGNLIRINKTGLKKIFMVSGKSRGLYLPLRAMGRYRK